jgi:FMN reductase [NAD(P)H]
MTVEISEAIAQRKAIRAYLDKPVLADDLAKIVEAGRWAPNAGDFHLSVIRSPELRRRINDATRDVMVNSDREFLRQRVALPGYEPLYGAPVLILLSAPGDARYSAFNVALAAENMLLQATGLGLGSCFLMSPTLALNERGNRALARQAGVPDGYTSQCAISVGYAAAENRFTLGERTRRGTVNHVD